MSKDPFWSSSAVRAGIIAILGLLSMGAANIVREHGEDIDALKTAAAVKAAQYDRILDDLRAIKTHLGITP